MARIQIMGFETDFVDELASVVGNAAIQGVTFRSGLYALRTANVGNALAYAVVNGQAANGTSADFSATDAYYRFYFRVTAFPGAAAQAFFMALSTTLLQKLQLRITTTGTVTVLNAAAAIVGTTTATLTTGVWNLIQVYVGTGAVAGPFKLYLNGRLELQGTTDLTAAANGRCRLGRAQAVVPASAMEYFFDDLSIDDAEMPSPGRVLIALPRANGFYTAWVGTFSDVDNIPPLVAPNITSAVINTAETVLLDSAATIGASSIRAIKSFGVYRRDVGAPGTLIGLRTRDAATDFSTTTFAQPITYDVYGQIWDVEPSSGTAWDITTFDALEVGCFTGGTVTSDATASTLGAMVEEVDRRPLTMNNIFPGA